MVIPIANVNQIMRSVLPRDVKIEEDSKQLMAKFASKFISHITHEANRQCELQHRSIVTGDDLIAGMRRLGFERHSDAINVYLARNREDNIANGAGAGAGGVVPRQDPRNHVPVPQGGGNHEQVDVPMAPGTPPHDAAPFRAPSGLSGDEGGVGCESDDGETCNGSFGHVENLNRCSNFSG